MNDSCCDLENLKNILMEINIISDKYNLLYGQTGCLYNIFKIARVQEKEVIMCRVLADLLNRNGLHYKGDIFLRYFFYTIDPVWKVNSDFDYKNSRVNIEFSDKNRRIDIIIEDSKNWIPIEVKIKAKENKNQIRDYALICKSKNEAKSNSELIPVLFLTPEGRDSETASGSFYFPISFSIHIITWLRKCVSDYNIIQAAPIREVLLQLIAAVKLICNIPEDLSMENEIFEIITSSPENMRAAQVIRSSNVINTLKNRVKQVYKENVFIALQNKIHDAKVVDKDGDWSETIIIPILTNKYNLCIHFDWKSMCITTTDNTSNSEEISLLQDRMNELVQAQSRNGDCQGNYIWLTSDIHYKNLENLGEIEYLCNLYDIYKNNTDDVITAICGIVYALNIIENLDETKLKAGELK